MRNRRVKDSDFALIKSRLSGPQILWLRVGNVTKATLSAKLDSVWEELINELISGGAIIEVRR